MRLRLTAVAPIRVGGREQQVSKLEFLRYDGRLHAVSPRGLAELLFERSERALNDWNTEVLRKGQNADLTRFLRDKDLLNRETIGQVSRYSTPCDHQNVNQFHPQARDARGTLLVPGSAIKGAVRTAVMWALVQKQEANDYVGRTNERKDRFAQRLNEQALQSYRLPHSAETAAHRDLLRTVKVSDGYGDAMSRVENITIQSYVKNRGVRNASLGASRTIYVECLSPGSWVEFDLKVDGKILSDFRSQMGDQDLPFTDEASLLRLVQTFYAEVWDLERRYYGVADEPREASTPAEKPEAFPTLEEWIERNYGKLSKTQQRRYRGEYRVAREEFEADQGRGAASEQTRTSAGVRDGREIRLQSIRDFYKASSPGFRLGWGSGLMSTTVDMRLEEENIGKVLNVISSKHHPRVEPREGPKSRKLVGSGGSPRWPMGWAKLEVQR